MDEDETKPEPEETQAAEATEATETKEVTETGPSDTTEVEDASKITEAEEDTSPKVEGTDGEVTEEYQAGEPVEEGAEEKTAEEQTDVEHKDKTAATATTHKKASKPKKQKAPAKINYAYDAQDFVVDEKNIFAKIHDNVFTENLNIFGQPRQSTFGPVVSFSSSGGEEGEEEEPYGYQPSLYDEYLHPGDFGAPIDREAYIDEYRILLNERVFDDIDPHIADEIQLKYERKIDEFYEFRTKLLREREGIENEIYEMKNLRDEQEIELEDIFHTMLLREKEVATGLIDTKTGKTISDKLISTLIQRQRTKSSQVGEIRLGFIKTRDKVRAIEATLKSLETIGGTLHLMDFEQIRMENQTCTDKIEERDDELLRLRTRFSTAIQELTHARLKSHVLEEEITHSAENTAAVEEEFSKAREYLTNLKLTRDRNRSKTTKMQLNSGLLTHTKLLQDMEITINQLAEFENVYEELNTINKNTRQKILIIRHNIETAEREQWQQKKSQPQYESNLNITSSDKKSCLPNVTVKPV